MFDNRHVPKYKNSCHIDTNNNKCYALIVSRCQSIGHVILNSLTSNKVMLIAGLVNGRHEKEE